MKKLLLILTLLFSVMFSSSSFAEWKMLGRNIYKTAYYVDFSNIRVSDGYVYFWVIANSIKPDKWGDLSSKIFYQLDCKILGFKVLNDSYYPETMARGKPSSSSSKPDINWTYAPPGSTFEHVTKAVCNFINK